MDDKLLTCEKCKADTPHRVVTDEELGTLAQCRRCGTVQSGGTQHSGGTAPAGADGEATPDTCPEPKS